MTGFWFALSLTFLSGIATILGGLLATHKIMLRRGAMAVALGFSAGAMLYVSFTDILGKSLDAFSELYDKMPAYGLMSAAFFAGILVLVFLNRLIPDDININEQEGVQPKKNLFKKRLMRSGILIGVALCIHNFPEGFLVFINALENPGTGIAVAIALAIHNIPEGVAVGVPLYAATKSRFKTVGLTALTGLAEPVGAIIGYLLLRDVSEIIRNVFGTPGIGQYSFYELRCRLNTACEQGLLVNLPHGKYALPVHHTSSSEPDDVLIHRIRQAGINPLSAVRSYSVRDKA